VDIVVNLDIPTHSKDYIHRVGRTARAGRSGKAYTFVSQLVQFQNLFTTLSIVTHTHTHTHTHTTFLRLCGICPGQPW